MLRKVQSAYAYTKSTYTIDLSRRNTHQTHCEPAPRPACNYRRQQTQLTELQQHCHATSGHLTKLHLTKLHLTKLHLTKLHLTKLQQHFHASSSHTFLNSSSLLEMKYDEPARAAHARLKKLLGGCSRFLHSAGTKAAQPQPTKRLRLQHNDVDRTRCFTRSSPLRDGDNKLAPQNSVVVAV